MTLSHLSSAPSRSKLLWLLISGTILALVALLSQQRTLIIADDLIQDFTIASQQHALTGKVIIVAIDDDSIATFGRWPWRRSLHAELLNRISEQHPAAIGLDILFSEADLQHPEDDQLLAAAMEKSGVVILPVVFSETGRLQHVQVPHPLLSRHAAGMGHVHIKVDYDGVVRSIHMQQDADGKHHPHFSQATLDAANHPGVATPSPKTQTQLIPYAGNAGYFPRISYRDVIEGRIPDDVFKDKLVLVGATATGIGDQYATPVSRDGQLMPGVEILANILESQLSGHLLTPASPWQNILLNLTFVALALLGFMLLSPLWALLLSFSLLLLLLLVTYIIALSCGILLAPSAGGLGLMLIYPLWSWHRLDTAARFLASEFESFKREFPMLSTPLHNTAFNDFLDRRINALHEATSQLQGMHRFISDSVNGLPDPTLVCDPHGIIRIANQAAARYFGVHSTAILLQQPLIPLVSDIHEHQANQPVINAQLLQAPVEIEVEARDGKQRELLIKFAPCKDASGHHIGWILSIIDVSKLWQAERDRDEAFRFITHDIRAPLSSIISLVELQKLTPDKIEERWLGMIEKHADNALALADDFVQLTRAKSGHYQLNDINLEDLLHEAIDDAWIQAYSRDITIALTDAPPEVHARVDRTLFKRAIANLLSNAIKFSPDHATITCSIAAEGQYWSIAVKDSGIGISPEAQSQLFQSFSRIHQQSHPHIEGTGLGLAFVHAVAARHQGEVRVTSVPGAGSTFHLLVPIQQ
ncbi:CHASE2 domain-containing protein [Methylobacillus arboreus]|uniref:CHASE2 domain-containing protein n=1 Tax=Methylobacillus arboreus TaxID=755170 RepID=UPI001E460BA0|nr:CHASE2 domain-containing protein [Methylobacillus arboreus]MCB5191205.1 CHASE2 domain-containing protein [Methylobacillus arboreus]